MFATEVNFLSLILFPNFYSNSTLICLAGQVSDFFTFQFLSVFERFHFTSKMDGIYTVHRTYMYIIFLYNFECEEFITNKLETKSICLYFLGDLRRCGLVVMDFDCYTGDCGLIPTHGDSLPTHGNSLGKWMNLPPGQLMPCEGNCG